MSQLPELSHIITEVSRLYGKNYLNRLVERLAFLIKAQYVYISALDDSKEFATVVSGWERGQKAEPIRYEISTTPCRELALKGACAYNLNVQSCFPEDQHLVNMGVNSYMGVVLISGEGEKIGLLNALFDAAIPSQEWALSIFELVSIRVSVELERLQYQAVLQDRISELESKNQDLLLASNIYKSAKDGILIADKNFIVTSVNPSYEKMFDVRAEEIIGSKYLDAEKFEDAVKITQIFEGPKPLVCESSLVTVNMESGLSNYVVFNHDITEEKNSRDLLNYYGRHDALTGLLNRFSFVQAITNCIHDKSAEFQRGAFVVMDVDNFKPINESMGHGAGDQLLKELASRIIHVLGSDIPCARVGADEFAFFFDCHGKSCVDDYMQQIFSAIGSQIQVGKIKIPISATAGVSFYPDDSESSEGLFNCATQALGQSKGSGRNSYSFFDKEMRDQASRFQVVYQQLFLAISHQELQVHYQPIYWLDTMDLISCEALCRWHSPKLGWVSPVEFIDVAEKTGLIEDIGKTVFSLATQFVSELKHKYGRSLNVSINCSPSEVLANKQIGSQWLECLGEVGIASSSIIIEITENLMIKNPELALNQLNELSKQGFTLSIDDFGTGYSSLSYLKDYPFNTLKIDRSFVSDMHKNNDSRNLVKTIISMAKSLNLKTVAEGVECAEQLELLKEYQCDMAQGYFLSRPLDKDAMIKVITEQG